MFTGRTSRLLALLALAACAEAARAESTSVAWRNNLDAAKIEAAGTNRLLLLHFWNTSCAPCKVLEQQVFSQPQVGVAIERDFVPVKIDTDASPALVQAFRIKQVPTEVILDPQGNVLATLATPNTTEAYLGQLSKAAQHFRNKPGPASAAATVNAAYAGLPVGSGVPAAAAAFPSTADPSQSRYGQTAGAAFGGQPSPQQQANPYIVGSPAPGQASPGYPAAQPTPGQPVADQVGATVTSMSPTMPPNAMPRSFQAAISQQSDQLAATSTGGVATQTNQPASPNAPPQSAPGPTAKQASAASAPALPDGCPPVGFDGCCPVTLKKYRRWAAGNVAHGAVHRGRTYLFVGPAERDQFLADPDAYSPVFAGCDPVLLLEQQQSTPGNRRFGYEYENRFYLFASKETMEKFAASAATYAAGVRQAMNQIDASQGGVIRR